MAANANKTAMANRALMILNAGRTGETSVLFDSITDEQFASWSTVPVAQPDKRLVCFAYERILKQVLLDMQPAFARQYADLGQVRAVNQHVGGWDYLFELPADFLGLIRQCSEGDHTDEDVQSLGYRCDVLHLKGYSHVVVGTDDNAYYCDTAHTSATQPPADAANWTLTTAWAGATWAAGVAYKYDATGSLLATNDLTNADGDSAYIQYIAYALAGRNDQPQYYPESFANAFATRLAAEMALDGKDYERRRMLLDEYESIAKPAHWRYEARNLDRVRTKTALERRLG